MWLCYLLYSESTKRSYIGATVNMNRRIRQHNREIKGGAKMTGYGMPWTIICNIKGFQNESQAKQFEWKFQRIRRSKNKPDYIKFKTSRTCDNPALKNKILCLYWMLNLEKWTSLAPEANTVPLTVEWFQDHQLPIDTPTHITHEIHTP